VSDFGIDADAINRYVSEKIIESSIGEALRNEIDAQVKRLAQSYENPMKPVVANAIAAAAREYLETDEVKARLEAVVRGALTDEALDGFIQKIVSEGYRR
jgi:predicted transcriptional regulator